MNHTEFTLRVYALIINERRDILLSDEFRFGKRMTKFPGGGMHYGEGTIDCLQREAKEEMGQPLCNIRHFYTTDFFQPSEFHQNVQVISIYYRADLSQPEKFIASEKPFDFIEAEGNQSFRFVPLVSLKKEQLTFPIDRVVLGKIQASFIL